MVNFEIFLHCTPENATLQIKSAIRAVYKRLSGLVSMETAVLRRWEWKRMFPVINLSFKGNLATVKSSSDASNVNTWISTVAN